MEPEHGQVLQVGGQLEVWTGSFTGVVGAGKESVCRLNCLSADRSLECTGHVPVPLD